MILRLHSVTLASRQPFYGLVAFLSPQVLPWLGCQHHILDSLMTKPAGAPSELAQAVGQLRPYFIRAVLFSLFASFLVLAPTAYMLEVYERVLNSRSYLTLAMLTLLLLGLLFVMEVLEWSRAEQMHQAGLALDQKLRTRVFDVVFDAKLKQMPGGSHQPLTDLKIIRDFLGSAALFAAMEAPVALSFLILIFAMGPLLGWSAVIGAVIQTSLAWANERSAQPMLLLANQAAVAAQGYADNTLRNAQVIESMGMLNSIHQKWLILQRKFLGLQAQASDRAGVFQALSKFWQNTVSSALLGIGCWLMLHDSLAGGAGMVIIGSVLGGRVLAPLVLMVSQWQSFINVRQAWARLSRLLDEHPAQPPSMPLPPPKGVLQVEALVAGAPGAVAPILRGVQFALIRGEVLAVVGPSASGKTTLARLLTGIWPSLNGKVRLDGVDVYAWKKAELGPHVGYLPQDVDVFDGTVAQNIARFAQPDAAKVEAAARLIGLHGFICTLPLGYDTQIGHAGLALSGGQRQMLGLARALYGDPVFVVLDEPNSSLDDDGDKALTDAIFQRKNMGTTFVVMTHRTSVLAVTDKMLLLRDGQVQMFGPRDEVMAKLQAVPAAPVVVKRSD